jgi:hypothetical protein
MVFPSCFMPVPVAVAVIVSIIVAVTSFQFCQFYGAISFSSDVTILC